MLSRALRQHCALCRKSLSKQHTALSFGTKIYPVCCFSRCSSNSDQHFLRQKNVQKLHLPLSGFDRRCSSLSEPSEIPAAEQVLEDSSADKETFPELTYRTLFLEIPNSDVLPKTVQELSEDIIDVNLHYKTRNHSQAFLVFGSDDAGERNYRYMKELGMDVRLLGEMNRTLWILLKKSFIRLSSINNLSEDIESIRRGSDGDSSSYAYVKFPSEEVALANLQQLKRNDLTMSIAGRKEWIIKKVDDSRSLWLGYLPAETTEEQISSMSADPARIIFRQTEDGQRYAYLEYETEDLAEKNYRWLREKEVKVEFAKARKYHQQIADRLCTVSLHIGLKQWSDDELLDLSDDVMEAHVVQRDNGIRHAYLKFETPNLAEQNCAALKAKGYLVTCPGQEQERGHEANFSTLCLDFGDTAVKREMVMRLSSDILDVHTICRNNKSYAFVKFPTAAMAAENYELLKAKGINVEYTGNKLQAKMKEAESSVLWIGNLEWNTNKEDLENLCSDVIDVQIKAQSRHNVYAFLKFESPEVAERNLNQLKQRGFHVQLALGKKRNQARDTTLHVQNLDDDITEEDIKKISEDILEIQLNRLENHPPNAYLTFASEEIAEKNRTMLNMMGIESRILSSKQAGMFKEREHNTLYIKFGHRHIQKEELMGLSNEITSVRTFTKEGRMYALVVFPNRASAERHLKLFRSLELSAEFKTS